ncbi:recombination protein F [Bacteroidales bacterium Barb6XT]|nr:recombination protein F [Bacteroidales bacterium Barb6XT]
MAHLESLSLKNFRGFDRMEINGFSKINVLLGKNNCGKTSILEAIFLLFGMANPVLALRINVMREINTNENALRYLFHNFVTEEPLSFVGKFSDNVSRTLEVHPIYDKNSSSTPLFSSTSTSTPASPKFLGLDFSFSIKKEHEQKKSFKTWLRFEENGEPKQMLSPSYKEDIVATFLFTGGKDAGLSVDLESLIVDKKEDIINDLINKFDHTLKGIYPLPSGIYLDKEGLSERVPLNLMGEGLYHFLNIAANIAANKEKNFICLIDEIENGLHHDIQQLLWQSLFSLIRNTNVQLFITTHSLEILQSLNSVLDTEDYKEARDDVKIFTIANTKQAGFQSYGISYEGLNSAIENEIELRS